MKNVVPSSMVILILFGTLFMVFDVLLVEASGIIYIRADGSIDPPTANITTVDNVTYTFTDDINDSIAVERDDIVIDGAGYAVQGTGTYRGIDLTGRTNVTVQNTQITNFYYGIYLEYSYNNSVIGNGITANNDGIWSPNSSNYTRVSGNNITANSECGIMFFSSSFNSISENNIVYNWLGISVRSSSNCDATENNIIGNNITNISYGIQLHSTSDIKVSGNNITDTMTGIVLEYSSTASVSGNSIINNSGIGVNLLLDSSNNSISGNEITANGNGILFDSTSSYNSINENNITGNSFRGIWLEGSANNRFYHNNFIDNAQQINVTFWYGYEPNVWDGGYPSGGNYWSDYNGTDLFSGPYQNETGSDGIGDTPYIIDGDNIDRYPLMQPYVSIPGDLKQDGIVDIYDAIVATSAFGTIPGHPEWDSRVDLNKDEAIDIFDFIILASSFGKSARYYR